MSQNYGAVPPEFQNLPLALPKQNPSGRGGRGFRIFLTVAISYVSFYVIVIALFLCAIKEVLFGLFLFSIPFILPLLWLGKKNRKRYLILYASVFLSIFIAAMLHLGIRAYRESFVIDVTPNINTSEYLPFDEDSKIVKYDSKTLKLTDNLPIIAPVYAVTYQDNPNENVEKLLDWICSEEGQYIIEETGYVGLSQ